MSEKLRCPECGCELKKDHKETEKGKKRYWICQNPNCEEIMSSYPLFNIAFDWQTRCLTAESDNARLKAETEQLSKDRYALQCEVQGLKSLITAKADLRDDISEINAKPEPFIKHQNEIVRLLTVAEKLRETKEGGK